MVTTSALTGLTLLAGATVVSLAGLSIRAKRVAITLLLAAIVVGQIIRFPLPGQGGGLLFSDVAVVLVLLTALGHALFSRTKTAPATSNDQLPSTPARRRDPAQGGGSYQLLLLIAPFIIWSLLSLVIKMPEHTVGETIIAAAYWIRLTAYLLLLPALVTLSSQATTRAYLRRGLLWVIAALVILGALQLTFIPNLAKLGGGWDPHQTRLTSTWLDPNFFGAFLGLTIPVLIALAILPTKRLGPLVLLLGSIVALVLTQSRSALIAALTTLVLLAPALWFKAPTHQPRLKLITAISLVLIGTVVIYASVLLFGWRLAGLFTVDPGVTARAAQLQQTWQVAAKTSFLGVGYNYWQYTARDQGLISNFTIHSRAGADNSLLALLATTGLPGVIAFVAPWLLIASHLLSRWFRQGQPLALAAVASIVFLFIHAQFLNSLLYAHLLLVLTIIVAVALTSRSAIDRPAHG